MRAETGRTRPDERRQHAGWPGGRTARLAAALVFAFAPAMTQAQERIITSHGISTFGDLKLPPDFDHLPYVNPEAPKGGEISEGVFGGFDSMNPFSVKGRAAAGSAMMLESILTSTADEIGASYCLLCTTLEYPEDRSWVIFHLRDDIRFSDGTPLTAEDVVFSYETFLDKGLSDFRAVMSQQFEGVEAPDPHTVKFTFRPGVATRDLPQFAGGLPIFSKAHYLANSLDLEEGSMVPFLGSGPYVPDRIDIGRSVSYRRNPGYWGEGLPINRGRNNFDIIRFEYFDEPNAAFEGFKAGIYSFRQENVSKQWAEQYDFPAMKAGTVVRAEFPSGVKAPGQAFLFNLRRAKWQDPRVRRAIGLMFNFEWSNRTLFYGLYDRIESFWENDEMAAEGPPSPEEVALLQPLVDEGLLPAAILTDPSVSPPVSNPERQLDRRNLRAASALLDEAGWTAGPDGMRRNVSGEKLTLEFLNDNPQFERIIAPYVENLRALGVDARLDTIDEAQYEVRTRNPAFDFDVITGNARTDHFSGSDLIQFFGAQSADNSVFNVMGLKSPAVDRLIADVMAAKTHAEITAAQRALDRVLRHEEFWVPQWYKASFWAAWWDFYRHPDNMPPLTLGELDFWWFDAGAAAALKAKGALPKAVSTIP